jgi:hypothetical protein
MLQNNNNNLTLTIFVTNEETCKTNYRQTLYCSRPTKSTINNPPFQLNHSSKHHSIRRAKVRVSRVQNSQSWSGVRGALQGVAVAVAELRSKD